MMSAECCVCGQNISKYKCPTCCVPYCSLTCWKSHRSRECYPPTTNGKVEHEETRKRVYEFETEDTVPIQKLALLENDPDLRQILQNPHVRSMLLSIDSASDPAAAIQTAMMEPIFVEFADQCLKLVESSAAKD